MEKRVYAHDGTQFNLTDRRRLLYYNWLPVLELDVDSQGANTIRRKYTRGLDLGGAGALPAAAGAVGGAGGASGAGGADILPAAVGGAGVSPAAVGGAGVSPAIDSAGGIGGLLATRDLSGASATRYIYFHDANGNVSQLIDRSAAALAAAYAYDAYGNTVYQTGPLAAENPIRFSTKYYDAELDDATTSDVSEGLYYYGYRYYGPRLGRWLSRDPIGDLKDHQLYPFLLNAPPNCVDPDGMSVYPANPSEGDGKDSPPLVPTPTPRAPLQPEKDPGGTKIPGTSGPAQNCAGAACGVNEWIDWPSLGLNCTQKVFDAAVSFVPSGCKSVPCKGVDEFNTRCQCGMELIVVFYRWSETTITDPKGQKLRVLWPNGTVGVPTQCDFHMIGRSPCNERRWRSKQDNREQIRDISDPWDSLYDAYPHLKSPFADIEQRCLCCDPKKMQLARNATGNLEFK